MAEQNKDKPLEKIAGAASEAARAESAPVPVRRYRVVLAQLMLALVAIAFAGLTFLVKTRPFFSVDLEITRSVQLINSPVFAWFMSLVSWPGFYPQTLVITLVIVGLIYSFGLRWESVAAMVGAAFSTLINVLVKDVVQRPRPASDLVNVFAILKSYSFPSGHVMFYLSFFGFLWFLVFSLLKPSVKRTLLLIFLGGLILFVGLSRIYLGEHWASDVLGSYLLGSLTLMVIIRFYLWGKKRFFVRQPVAPARLDEKH